MSAKEFVDTNVLVYAIDVTAGSKREIATKLLDRLWQEGNGCVSIQVLQEFYVAAMRKLKAPSAFSKGRVEDLCRWRVHSPVAEDVVKAIDLSHRFQISFWDGMVVRSATALRCETLWTEDLNDGQQFDSVTIQNPFARESMVEGFRP